MVEEFATGRIPYGILLPARRDPGVDISRMGKLIVWAAALTEHVLNGKITRPGDFGRRVRAEREAQGATQADFASLCGVGYRFVSGLENGKATEEPGEVLQVLSFLGSSSAFCRAAGTMPR